MSDMKVRITIEDPDGRTRTATLSFEGDGAAGAKKAMPAKDLLDRLEEMRFTVRRNVPSLEPGMLGEIHAEQLNDEEDRCHECGQPTWSLMEVIEDESGDAEQKNPIIDVDHDHIGDFCVHCGHFHLNDEMLGTGIFGFLEAEEFETLGEFLDALVENPPDEAVRTHLIHVLLRQERLHNTAAFRLRQKISQLRIEKHEARILELKEEEEKA